MKSEPGENLISFKLNILLLNIVLTILLAGYLSPYPHLQEKHQTKSIKIIYNTSVPDISANFKNISSTTDYSIIKKGKFDEDLLLAGEIVFFRTDKLEWIIVSVIMFLFFASISVYLLKQWKIQRSEQYKQLIKAEKEKQILIEHYSTLTENANDSIILTNKDNEIIDVNKHAEAMYEYSKEEFLKLHFLDIIKDKNCLYDERLIEIKQNNGLVYECVHETKSGSGFPVEISAKYIDVNGEKYLQNIIRDVSDTKEAYKQLERETRLFAVLSQVNQSIIQSREQNELFEKVCKIIIETGKFKFCWIGLVDEKKQEIIPEASCGDDKEYMQRVNLKLFELDSIVRPFKRTILSDSTIVIKNIYDENDLPWFDEAVKREFISMISSPIRKYGVAAGCFNLYASEEKFFNEKEVRLVEEISQDISFALDNLDKEKNRIRIENKIRENELRLSNLFKNLPGMTYRCKNDLSWTMEFISDGAKELTGYTPDELINNNIISYNDVIVEEQRDYVHETVDKSLKSHKQFSLVYKIKTKSGLLKWVLEKGTGIFDKGNNIIAIEGFIGDITKQKEYQKALFEESDKRKELEIIVERSPAIAYKLSSGKNFPVKFISKNITQFGYEANEFLSGNLDFADIILPDDKQKVWENIIESAYSGKNNFNQEYRIITKNGEEKWVDDRNWIEIDVNGKVNFIEGILTDITEKKLVEEELKKAKEKAEQINRLKGNFFANMSHELRTPLIGILGNAELIKDETENQEISDMATVIFQSGRRLNETLNMILDITKLETDHSEVQLEIADVIPLIKESIDLLEPAALDKRLKFRYNLNCKQAFANVNQSFFSSVVNNLLNNAIKYTLEGQVELNFLKFDDKIIISVSDTGIGIESNYMDQIFEPFRQASEGYARAFEGTGLGLTITKKYVELMNGKIEVVSEIGVGSTFKVTFPGAQGISENNEFNMQVDENTEFLIGDKVLKKILILDDDETSLKTLSTFIQNEYEVDTISEAESAIVLAKSKRYDAFLLDIGLKGALSGLDVANEIKKMKTYNNVPLIAVTAFAMAGDKEKILEGGCSHYISKPCSKKELLTLLKTALEEKNNQPSKEKRKLKMLNQV